MKMALFNPEDLPSYAGQPLCTCRCTDNHPIAHGSRVSFVCTISLPADFGVPMGQPICDPCLDAMKGVYA